MKMKFNPITLVFTGPHRRLEAPFRERYFRNTIPQVRLAIAIAMLFFAAYGLIDTVAAPDQKYLFWAIRWGFACPICLLALGFSYTKHAPRFLQPVLCVAVLLSGWAVIAMIMLAPATEQYVYLYGLVQTLFFVYTFFRIRFVWAASVFWLILLTYAVCVFIGDTYSHQRLIFDTAFLFGINIMGMLACYSIEYYTRRNFFLARQLESKSRHLDMANQFLEERVQNRTLELTRTNQLLELEIKERKAIEKALQESKSRYRRMVNNVTDFIAVHDLNGTILELNYRMLSGLGYSHKEIVGLNVKDLIVPEQRANFAHYLNSVRHGGKSTGTVTVITKTGQLRLLEFSNIKAQHTNGGEVIYCLARDITEHQRAERALAESQAQFKDIFETAAAGMMIANTHSAKIVEVNPAAALMIGEPIEGIKGQPLERWLDTPAMRDQDLHDLASIDPLESVLKLSPQNLLPILKTVRTMEFNGQPHLLISFISTQKIKEAEAARREAETKLNRAQHLQAIGTLAGGIAHDFNNILYGVIGYTQLALDDAPAGSQLQGNLLEILQGSRRAKELIAQILTFSRQDGTQKNAIRPMPLVKEALKLLRASIPSTIDIQAHIAPDVSNILANPTQIHQVIMNLCTNAAHAMLPQGGLLQVAMDQIMITKEEVLPHGRLCPGEYVRLRISDSGAGMSEGVKDRIFEPFFTTKPQGEGTGMGLSVVLGVVQTHHGAIRVQSELGKGACFEILLPAFGDAEVTELQDEAQTIGGTERILLVDDENALIQMGKQMLAKLGYEVTACADAMEALELFRQAPADYDLVITDLTMPKLKGTKLAQHLLHIRPDLPIILCTGYGDQISAERVSEMGIRELMLKPILRNQMASVIRRVLDIETPLSR